MCDLLNLIDKVFTEFKLCYSDCRYTIHHVTYYHHIYKKNSKVNNVK